MAIQLVDINGEPLDFTSGGGIIPSASQIVYTNPAFPNITNLQQALDWLLTSQGNFAQAVTFDTLSDPVNPVNQISAAATALLNTWNYCTATSGNYTVPLPSAAANQGAVLGIEIDPFSTGLVTLQGYAGEFIDYDNVNGTPTGQNTRIMWAAESAQLKSTKSSTGVWYWHKTGGKTIPMSASLGVNGAQTFAANVTTLLNFGTTLGLTGPSSMIVAGSYEMVVPRGGNWNLSVSTMLSTADSVQGYGLVMTYKNGAQLFGGINVPPASQYGVIAYAIPVVLAAGDYLQMYGNYQNGNYVTSFLYNDAGNAANRNRFTLTEVSPW